MVFASRRNLSFAAADFFGLTSPRSSITALGDLPDSLRLRPEGGPGREAGLRAFKLEFGQSDASMRTGVEDNGKALRNYLWLATHLPKMTALTTSASF
ncbi:hypothetical protein AOQ71_36420 [Bradyrhizobium manausense]|uniref:Uncharacterized protein n=1 Tax=Bradyrhizobium manausense TaxID=989370 RepID=A0A0R3CX11_9BRAD|nr:hypothetical protein AOQ71_36420 [Bradyrhizobium manausense]